MIADLSKPNGPASVISSRSGEDMIPLGHALKSIAANICRGRSPHDAEVAGSELAAFLQAHERYADPARLARLSSPQALKAWAAERLPGLRISYSFANTVSQESVQSNLDQHASLRMVQLVDELTLLARFCRDIQKLEITASPHSHGLEFRCAYQGRALSLTHETIEAETLRSLAAAFAKENSLKSRVDAKADELQATTVLLRKRVRLGFSPLF